MMRSEPENILQILAIDQGGKNGKKQKKDARDRAETENPGTADKRDGRPEI
ncbi:MAG: hypothetical protein J5858_11455 [Lentisphaeria bacterium]|nr:hypothetical protein [Lentisphaeria bacterium]